MEFKSQDLALLEAIKKDAQEIVEAGNGVRATGFFFTKENRISIVPLNEIMGRDKDLYWPVMTSLLHTVQARFYVLLQEAWMSNSPQADHVPISDLPLDDRFSVLVVSAVENGVGNTNFIARIEEDFKGSRKLLEWNEEPVFKGRLVIESW